MVMLMSSIFIFTWELYHYALSRAMTEAAGAKHGTGVKNIWLIDG